ncbi:MAG TPA: hypothetical protein VJS64_02365 [Pyrinomonadaceae bacterium]|nr:hypothetical protein [Pyrinomonadaceae bacterium]
MSKWKLFNLLALVLTCACASKKIITISDESTGVSLKYDCSHFVSQVRSGAEANAVRRQSNEVLKRANEEGNTALSRSIYAARAPFYDPLRLEELTVKDQCAHLK